MGSHCFILGAGFSRAYSSYAPLMSDFLELARDRGFYEPEGRHKTLAELASTYFGSPLNVNIESLASSLAVKTGTFLSLEPRAEVAYADLVGVIEATLKHIYEYPIDSSTKHLFSKFAHALVRIQDDAAIITLNYDLLMDQLLRDTEEWFPIDGYGFDLPIAAFSTATNERLLAEAKARKGKPVEEPLSAIRLLKMHGSLNWGTRNLPYPDGTLPVELAFLGALPHDPGLRATAEESSKLTPVNFSVIQRLRPTSYYWKPYIIPPLLTKIAGQTSNPLIENSWFQARGAIAFADSVHLLGYSMPPSDFEMEMLLREGLHSRVPYKPNRRVFVVNRDVMTAKRIKTVLEFGDVTIDISRSDIIDHLTAILPELTG